MMNIVLILVQETFYILYTTIQCIQDIQDRYFSFVEKHLKQQMFKISLQVNSLKPQ